MRSSQTSQSNSQRELRYTGNSCKSSSTASSFTSSRPAHLFALPLILLLAACQSHTRKTSTFTEAWTAGDAQRVGTIIARMGEAAPTRDKVVFRLEEGTVMLALSRTGESDRAFLDAEVRIATMKNP